MPNGSPTDGQQSTVERARSAGDRVVPHPAEQLDAIAEARIVDAGLETRPVGPVPCDDEPGAWKRLGDDPKRVEHG
jgi:hypothetical protein